MLKSGVITETITKLEEGKVILYPTDTVWGIGCDATNPQAVQSIYDLKQRSECKSLVVLVNSLQMLRAYVQVIPPKALSIIKNATNPVTIIYEHPIGFAPNTIASDGSIAIRLVKHEFCEQLISAFGKPLVSTSANISGAKTPLSFSEISDHILNGVDYIVPLPAEKTERKASTILKIKGEDIIMIRE